MAATTSSMHHQQPEFLPPHRRCHHRIPTNAYNDQRGLLLMHYYQPMLDYLDAAKRCRHQPSVGQLSTPPRLTWSSTEYRAPDRRDTFLLPDRVHKSAVTVPPFSARFRELKEYTLRKKQSSPPPPSTLAPFRYPSVEQRIIRDHLERKSEQRVQQIMDQVEQTKRRFKSSGARKAEMVEFSSECKKQIRGRTANQITSALMAESERNIRKSNVDSSSAVCTTSSSSTKRSQSENRLIKRTMHIELMDDRMLDHLDTSMSTSLHGVKQQLSSFNQRADERYQNSRLRTKFY